MFSRDELVTLWAWIEWPGLCVYLCFCIGGWETSFPPNLVLLAGAVEVGFYAALLRKIGMESCNIRGNVLPVIFVGSCRIFFPLHLLLRVSAGSAVRWMSLLSYQAAFTAAWYALFFLFFRELLIHKAAYKLQATRWLKLAYMWRSVW